MSYTYWDVVMGPCNREWMDEHGHNWVGGRIEIFNDVDKYPDEVTMPLMDVSNYCQFSDWLMKLETDEPLTTEEIVDKYRKEGNELKLCKEMEATKAVDQMETTGRS